jgi:hypothetical protein
MPLETLQCLHKLAEKGATVVFQDQLPKDVPGLGNLEERRRQFREIIAKLYFQDSFLGMRESKEGTGRFIVGEIEAGLIVANNPREHFVEHGNLLFVRRMIGGEHCYFICNHGTQAFDDWIQPAHIGDSMTLMDPMTGQCGAATVRDDGHEVRLQLAPGGSIILGPHSALPTANQSPWRYWQPHGDPVALSATWKVDFIEGGPTLPKSYETTRLASWTESGDEEAKGFGGTARYRIEFDAPKSGSQYQLDLGKVCQSARVRLNGKEVATLLLAPYQTVLENLKPRGNVLEVEVTNVAANRIRDLDRRHIEWRKFRDINFASIDYKKFDASNWPINPSGLLGPVTLQPISNAE